MIAPGGDGNEWWEAADRGGCGLDAAGGAVADLSIKVIAPGECPAQCGRSALGDGARNGRGGQPSAPPLRETGGQQAGEEQWLTQSQLACMN